MQEGPLALLQLIWWMIDKVAASIKLQPGFCLPMIMTIASFYPSPSAPAPLERTVKKDLLQSIRK